MRPGQTKPDGAFTHHDIKHSEGVQAAINVYTAGVRLIGVDERIEDKS